MDCKYEIGDKIGCLTVIKSASETNELINNNGLDKKHNSCYGRHKYLGEFDTKNNNYYVCRCKCGKEWVWSEIFLGEHKMRYCDRWHPKAYKACNLRAEADKRSSTKLEEAKKNWKIEIDSSCNIQRENTLHDTLYITRKIEPVLVEHKLSGKGNKYKGYFEQFDQYECKCTLCGKQYSFRSDKFSIQCNRYGEYAGKGYYSEAHCDCHEISSFQWRTIDIFNKYGVRYWAEYSFDDLKGISGKHKLRFDFALFDHTGTVKMLVECQGQQHYKAVESFGGEDALIKQRANDRLKAEYAEKIGIRLIKIPYTCKSYDKEEKFLEYIGLIYKEYEYKTVEELLPYCTGECKFLSNTPDMAIALALNMPIYKDVNKKIGNITVNTAERLKPDFNNLTDEQKKVKIKVGKFYRNTIDNQ